MSIYYEKNGFYLLALILPPRTRAAALQPLEIEHKKLRLVWSPKIRGVVMRPYQ